MNPEILQIWRLQAEAKNLKASADAATKQSMSATSELREELRRVEGRLEEARAEAARAKAEAAKAGGREGEWRAEKVCTGRVNSFASSLTVP